MDEFHVALGCPKCVEEWPANIPLMKECLEAPASDCGSMELTCSAGAPPLPSRSAKYPPQETTQTAVFDSSSHALLSFTMCSARIEKPVAQPTGQSVTALLLLHGLILLYDHGQVCVGTDMYTLWSVALTVVVSSL